MFIVQIAGHLGKDPEVRFTPSGQKVTSFTLATNHRKGKEDVTIWVRVTVWGDRLDKVISYLKKGSAVVVIGKMNPPSSYVDKEGKTQTSLEVTAEMIEFSPFGKSDRGAEGQATQSSFQQQEYGYEEPSFNGAAQHKPAGFGATAMGSSHANNNLDDDALPF
jgi:single-strand DNA-binding protein